MTRQEFIDNVEYWYELIDFCNDIECDICENIISGDNLEENIREDFNDFGSEYPWTDIRSWLNDIVDGYDYYVRQGSFEYEHLRGDDFAAYKDEVLDYMDRNDLWDDVDEDGWEETLESTNFEYSTPEIEDDEEFQEEDISVSDLFSACSGVLRSINESKVNEAENPTRFVCNKK